MIIYILLEKENLKKLYIQYFILDILLTKSWDAYNMLFIRYSMCVYLGLPLKDPSRENVHTYWCCAKLMKDLVEKLLKNCHFNTNMNSEIQF